MRNTLAAGPHPARRALTTIVLALGMALALLPGVAHAGGRATPGDFTGYGFDQCHTPSQAAMSQWLLHSPYWAVGVYTSGYSRGCRSQPNLTPAWVDQQLRDGWRLLPITLGPQASCNPRFPRYGNDPRISSSRTDGYARARAQGRATADEAVSAATALGIAPGSTLWYDLEAWDLHHSTRCNRSALWFVSAWTDRLHQVGYRSGFYSSAASGIRLLDHERQVAGSPISLPDQLWIADWNGRRTVRSDYIGDEGWMPHSRIHQYVGGHDETFGGVTINVDRNWLDVGRGSRIGREPRHCGGIALNLPDYGKLAPGSDRGAMVQALKCRLRERGYYRSRWMGPDYNRTLVRSVHRYQADHDLAVQDVWNRPDWMVLLSSGSQPLLKVGAATGAVRRVQRALIAAGVHVDGITGVFSPTTLRAVRAYQRKVGMGPDGVVDDALWARLQSGDRSR